MRSLLLTSALLFARPAPPRARRGIKDLVSIEGVRDNQLVGYGVVVGLNKTGDKQQTIFSTQSLANMLREDGRCRQSRPRSRFSNTAAVMVTATLPPFAQPGTKIDVTAAAIGDASNLQGGLLLMTSLRGTNGQVYAVAQGPIVTGGFVAGRGGVSQTVNHPTVGRSPNGATVERLAPSVEPGATFVCNCVTRTSPRPPHRGSYQQGVRNGQADCAARKIRPLSMSNTPARWTARMTRIHRGSGRPEGRGRRPAKIVVNERTGTIVMGKDVRIAPVAILHGNLSVEIQTNLLVSQPGPLSQGKTEVVPAAKVAAKEEATKNVVLKQGATVEELVRALTAIGSTARDIIAILQNLRAAGALDAELEVI